MNNQKDIRRAGLYWKTPTEPYLSVTSALGVINKPQLAYWYGQQVYYAVAANPSLDEKAALAAPYKTSNDAKERGSTIHTIIEAFKSTEKHIENIPAHIQPYAFAFYDFMRDHNPTMIAQEKTVFNDTHRIAGTLDIYCKIGETEMIVDVKTGKDIYQEAGLQLSAYAQMLRSEGKPVKSIAVLLLETGTDGKPTGKYKFQTMTEDFDAFLAAKKLYEYVNRERLIKLGYLK